MPSMPRKTFSISNIILDIISFVKPFFYYFPYKVYNRSALHHVGTYDNISSEIVF